MKSVVVVLVALGLFWEASNLVVAFNINADVRHVWTFDGPVGSYFGLSVLGHQNGTENWILVGAPNSTSDCQSGLPGPPGVLYKCQVTEGGNCSQVRLDSTGNEKYTFADRDVEDKKDGQLLGMGLTRQPGPEGKVVVCGHRWMNQDRATRYPTSLNDILLFPRGICYRVNAGLEPSSVEKIRPCITESSSDWWLCLSGASAEYAVDGQTLLLGAPGSMYYRGSVITVSGNDITHFRNIWSFPYPNHQYPSVGYSMSSGHFSSPSAVEGVTGAPRYLDKGAVYIFDVDQQTVIRKLIGELVNTYFGASVEAVDLNNDLWSDLLVGAPLYSTNQDEGCVYVYINDGMGNLEMRHKLRGSNAIGARFGSAIETIGDLNKDHFTDVAVGAPYEDDMSGAVYIYHGTSYGINPKYSQRISGRSFGLISFGYSLDGMDLDSNEYPDLIVGAHLNNSVVYLRTKPIVFMQAMMVLSPTTLIMQNTSYVNNEPIQSRVTICLRYDGTNLNASQDVVYTLEADSRVSSILQSRVYFGSSVSASRIEETIRLDNRTQKCVNHTMTLKNFVQDFLNPIPVELSYRLDDNDDPMAPVLSPSSMSGIYKEIAFGRDCGTDNICKADLQFVNYSYSLRSGKDEIRLGADTSVFISVEISNDGEEAHQARLVITHPENVVYEAVETIRSTENIGVKCDPVSLEDGSAPYIDCSIGNPLRRAGKVLLQVRMDIGNLALSQTELNVLLSLSTSSSESNLDDNQVVVSVPVILHADITMNGASTPEQLVYKQDKDNLQQYLGDILKTVRQLRDTRMSSSSADQPRINHLDEAVVDLGGIYKTTPPMPLAPPESDKELDLDEEENAEMSINDTEIGPAFSQQFEIANLGPGRVPYATVVNISIPWRTREGAWLIFITDVQGRDGVESCNLESVLKQQYQAVLQHYNTSSQDQANPDTQKDPEMERRGPLRTTFNCESAECVMVNCLVQPLATRSSAVIKVRARLWKYSFLKSSYGLVLMVFNTSAEVKNPQGLFNQPEADSPDTTTVKITVSAEKIQSTELPLPPWVIPGSVCLGIALLFFMVVGMSKLGFFRRQKVEEMKRQLMGENTNATEQEDNLEYDEESKLNLESKLEK